jgi:hypothetical protein
VLQPVVLSCHSLLLGHFEVANIEGILCCIIELLLQRDTLISETKEAELVHGLATGAVAQSPAIGY